MKSVNQVKRQESLKKWLEIIKDQRASGLSALAYCKREGIANTTLFFGASLWPCPAHCHRGHVIQALKTDALRSAGCVPSMLIRELTAEHIYLACGHTDMRKSIDGLAALVVSRFHLDPHQPALFLFCGRRKDRIKGLLWDETGFLLLYKRLEDGKYQWPDESKDVLEISEQQLRWLTEGLTGDCRWAAESLQRGGGRSEEECA